MKPPVTTSELLSALADGQLNGKELDAALQACGHDASALGCWNTYHVIGDVLRSPANLPAARAFDAELAFLGRFNQRLAQEPAIRREPASLEALAPPPLQAAADLIHHRGSASNDGNFRWKLVAGVASLAAVSAIAWSASGLLLAPAPLPQLAQSSSPQIVVTSAQGPMVRDARLEELLAAHKQFGATSVFQESSGFLRNATFEMHQDAQTVGGR
ncbi:MAG: anti sigma-E protein RseA [Polaromonas sp.]|nr:anti sigma-E protein RseA [Polaromonas sp.]MDB5869824.1 anti sigma-E protein RseA [Polaromonas sp.]